MILFVYEKTVGVKISGTLLGNRLGAKKHDAIKFKHGNECEIIKCSTSGKMLVVEKNT